MAHLREQIRKALVTRVTGLTTAGARVHSGRAHAIPEDKTPAIRVYFWRETSTVAAMSRTGANRMERRALFVVHLYATAAGFEDALDDMAEEVEAAIGAEPTLGGLCLAVLPAQAEAAPPDGSGALRAGETALVFEATYHTTNAAPGTAI
jgi:hypothetical protein